MMSMGGLAGAEDLATAEATVALVEQNAGDLVQPAADSTVITPDGTVSNEAGVEVFVPLDQGEPIAVVQETLSGVEATVEIGLPDLGGPGESDIAGDGQSVFGGDEADIVVQPVEGGGVQALVTLETAEAPTDFPFQVDVTSGGALAPQPDGSVQVVAADGTLLGDFASPWAIDANGNPVATWFTVSAGGELTQHVETTAETVFPVVADPCYSCWFSTGWRITKCASAIAGAVGLSMTAYRWVKVTGGVTAVATKLVQGKITAQVLTSVFAGVGGIDTILSWCRP